MPENEELGMFQKEHAAVYDKQVAKLAPLREGLHLLTRIMLGDLPEDARILCVGAGTGSELFYLAEAFPKWHFTALDPAAPMLEICRKQVEAKGFAERCTFHEGYLDSLPECEPFHAATSFLVSHFIMDKGDRRDYFAAISNRLAPGGHLVSCDIASDAKSESFASLLEVWMHMLRYSGMPEERIEGFRGAFGVKVALLPPQEIAELIRSAGFGRPQLFWQSLLMHAHFAVKLS